MSLGKPCHFPLCTVLFFPLPPPSFFSFTRVWLIESCHQCIYVSMSPNYAVCLFKEKVGVWTGPIKGQVFEKKFLENYYIKNIGMTSYRFQSKPTCSRVSVKAEKEDSFGLTGPDVAFLFCFIYIYM